MDLQTIPPVVLIWLGLAIVFAIVEIFTVGFFFMFFAAGALITALVAFILPDVLWQTVIFLAVSLITFFYARPLLKKTLNITDTPSHMSNSDALLNKLALVLERVERHAGKVKMVHTGEIWTAYLADETQAPIESGEEVLVIKVDGAKLAVTPK